MRFDQLRRVLGIHDCGVDPVVTDGGAIGCPQVDTAAGSVVVVLLRAPEILRTAAAEMLSTEFPSCATARRSSGTHAQRGIETAADGREGLLGEAEVPLSNLVAQIQVIRNGGENRLVRNCTPGEKRSRGLRAWPGAS